MKQEFGGGKMPVDKNNIKEKPNYGIYVGYSIIISFLVLGVIGLLLFILGFYVSFYFNIIMWIIGVILVILFFWPRIGMSLTNLAAHKQDKINFDFVKKFKKVQILDCGCGTGRHAIPLAKHIDKGSFLTGIDIFDPKSISGNSLKRVQKNAEIEGVSDKTKFTPGSVTDIPFGNESFDIVTCMGVIHHLSKEEDRVKAFEEIGRVLKPNGVFYFRELNRFANMPFMGIWGLFSLKNSYYWKKEIEKHNFHIEKMYKEKNTTIFLVKKE
jgi:ubiquinone/menaquinone biosynthesis C-methylase UbiE